MTQADSLGRGLGKTMLLADKGDDSNALVQQRGKPKAIVVMAPKQNRTHQRDYDWHII